MRRHLLRLLLVGAAPLAAQRPQGLEIGAFGSLTGYDASLALKQGWGGGARVGYFLDDHWSVEADVDFQAPVTSGGAPVTATFAAAGVLYNFGAARPGPYLTAGYTAMRFEPSSGEFIDHGLHLGVGGRAFLSHRLALRFEARGQVAPSTGAPGGGSAAHVTGLVGLSFFTRGGPPADRDGDGVPDAEDRCANTPRGAVVDPRGCPADSDADGVPNGIDACPNTPPGALVTRSGCPEDQDGDGVYDGLDQCPNTASGWRVDRNGCALDSDADGIADAIDQCPETPAGTPVDATGCPTARDSDGDGVRDDRDRCPETPAGTQVDALGCPVLFTPARSSVVLRGVTFESGKSRLLAGSYAVLDQVAAVLAANPGIRIEIAGYTDSTGSAAVNTRLSTARASAVRAYLARRGVALERMRAAGYGPAHPVAPNATAEGRAQNRRVELHQLP